MSNQIVFTALSSAELSTLPQLMQLEILREFEVFTPAAIEKHQDLFGEVKQAQRTIYRYRAREYRIYFEKTAQGILVHRVLHKNSLKDFLYRSQLPMPHEEDEILQANPNFWAMIDQPTKR